MSMENDGDDIVQGKIHGRDDSLIRKKKQKKRGTSKVWDPTMGVTSEGLTYDPPPQDVFHGEESDGSASGIWVGE